MPAACMHCQRETLLTAKGPGLRLMLCPTCEPAPDCGEFQHAYLGDPRGQTWLCYRCGSAKANQGISTTPVEVPAPDPYSDVC